MRTWVVAGPALLVCLASRPSAAQLVPSAPDESPASGFMVQGVMSASVSAGLMKCVGDTCFSDAAIGGALRLGGLWEMLAVGLDVRYAGVSVPGSGEGLHMVTAGPDLEFFVWRSAEGRARLYLLAGVDLGAAILDRESSDPYYRPEDDADLLAGLTLGLGGMCFLHRNFALGMEVGARTLFVRDDEATDDETVASAAFFAALSGTFVVGD